MYLSKSQPAVCFGFSTSLSQLHFLATLISAFIEPSCQRSKYNPHSPLNIKNLAVVANAADKVVHLKKNDTNVPFKMFFFLIWESNFHTPGFAGAVQVKVPLESTSVALNFEQPENCALVTCHNVFLSRVTIFSYSTRQVEKGKTPVHNIFQ